MLKDISYSHSCEHVRHRARNPCTTLEQLITVGTPSRDRHSDQNTRSILGTARCGWRPRGWMLPRAVTSAICHRPAPRQSSIQRFCPSCRAHRGPRPLTSLLSSGRRRAQRLACRRSISRDTSGLLSSEIDNPGRAVYDDGHAVGDDLGCVERAVDERDAELAGHDCGVSERPANLGDGSGRDGQ